MDFETFEEVWLLVDKRVEEIGEILFDIESIKQQERGRDVDDMVVYWKILSAPYKQARLRIDICFYEEIEQDDDYDTRVRNHWYYFPLSQILSDNYKKDITQQYEVVRKQEEKRLAHEQKIEQQRVEKHERGMLAELLEKYGDK